MYTPLHYQVSEYDCVPTALINAVSYLFTRKEIPPMVIRHIYLYCLDTVGRNARFGMAGTSKYAARLVGNWLDSYTIKGFSVKADFTAFLGSPLERFRHAWRRAVWCCAISCSSGACPESTFQGLVLLFSS